MNNKITSFQKKKREEKKCTSKKNEQQKSVCLNASQMEYRSLTLGKTQPPKKNA